MSASRKLGAGIWLLLGALAAVGAGCGRAVDDSRAVGVTPNAPPNAESPKDADRAPAQPDFSVRRPLDRLTAFMGWSRPPSSWQPVTEAAQSAIDSCVSSLGGTPLARPLLEFAASSELMGRDLGAYRSQFGYGVVEMARLEAEEIESNPNEAASLSPELEQLYNACASAGQAVYDGSALPRRLVDRYNELYLAAGEDSRYQRASEEWKLCMKTKQIDLVDVYGPTYAKAIVERELLSAQERAVSSGSAVDYSRAQVLELEVYRADSECLTTSGAGSIMIMLENEILTTLRAEFPDYDPPVPDPAGAGWAPDT